jgi:hypothetical protein
MQKWMSFLMNCFLVVFTLYLLYWILYEGRLSEDALCQRLYTTSDNQLYEVIPQWCTSDECDAILREGLEYARIHKWQKKRHGHYPTTDNQITFAWANYTTLQDKWSLVYDAIGRMYGVHPKNLGMKEMFLAKYEPKKQSHLRTHTDGSEFSFILALNDDYEGGGTYFPDTQTLVRLKKGECLVFSGQQRHRGERVTKGKRFIVTGFIHYVADEYCCYTFMDKLISYVS